MAYSCYFMPMLRMAGIFTRDKWMNVGKYQWKSTNSILVVSMSDCSVTGPRIEPALHALLCLSQKQLRFTAFRLHTFALLCFTV